MPASRPSPVIQRLRRAALAQEGGPTDAELMHRFVAHRDGDALEALVRRHGPMMLAAVQAIGLVGAGQGFAGAVSLRVAALAEGVLKTMLLTKLTVGFLAALVVVASGAAAYACRAPAAPLVAPAVANAAPAGEPAEPRKGEKPADAPRGGLTARIVAPKEMAADAPELKGELVLTNDGDAPVRVCTLTPGNDGLGGAFGQHFRPDRWKSDRPSMEKSTEAVVTLAPGKTVSFPFRIARVHYKDRDSFTITGFYAVEDMEFAKKLDVWIGKAEAKPVEVTVGKESAWGDADGGVQARLRTPKVVWKVGESPTFSFDLRNEGKNTPNAVRIVEECEIEVDGAWYTYGDPIDVTAVDTPLEPGKRIADWVRVAPDKRWVRKSLGAADGKPNCFPLPAGKYTIRIAYPLQGVTPRIRPVSGPVEIEIVDAKEK